MATSPSFALIECGSWDCPPQESPEATYRPAFRVEPFNPERHICPQGWTHPEVTLFDHPADVEHLRDLIIN